MSRTVLPSSCRRRIVSHAARRAAGSKPVVGSSRKISSGSPTSASARSRRRSWPPDSVRARASCLLLEPGDRDAPRRRRAGRGRSAAQCATASRTVMWRYMPQLCSTMPTRSRSAARRARRVVAEHGDDPARARPVALEDLDRRRLARAVGAEQPEDLAAGDLEVDAAHRLVRRRRPCAGRGRGSRAPRWTPRR